MKKDILVFLSDQHSGLCTGYAGDKIVRTPNLDRIAGEGTAFESAYTSCPLCVPARNSMLSGQLPSVTGIFENAGSIPSYQATFLHSLGAQGYETVLCGRMHFDGPDQRHGFTKRIFGDITPLYGGDDSTFRDNKQFGPTLRDYGCLEIIGGGNSPTLEYDRHVIAAALDYLKEEHKRPQCVVVGTYAPHYPYVAPPELYRYYLDKVEYPRTLSRGVDYDTPVYDGRLKDTSEETVRRVRAAYWGMVEFSDRNVGRVYEAWEAYLARSQREGVFVYLSDHGDQAGERGFYGKNTFFESAAHIPMIFSGSGVKPGARIRSAASIMDLGPTLCELAGAVPPPDPNGKSLAVQLADGSDDTGRYVVSELMHRTENGMQAFGRMVTDGTWKYSSFYGYEKDDLLFNLKDDPDELHNLRDTNPEKAEELRGRAVSGWDPEALLKRQKTMAEHRKILFGWVRNAPIDQTERWRANAEAVATPDPLYSSKAGEALKAKFNARFSANKK